MSDCSAADIKTEDGITVISFTKANLSASPDIDEVADQISELLNSQKACNIIVDFSKVKFFSSRTLGILLEVRKKLSLCQGRIVISGIEPQLYRVFRITNLDKIFEFFHDISAAVVYLKSKLEK